MTADKDKLIEMLSALTKPVEGVLVAKTPVRMNKRDTATKTEANPFIAVYKIAKTRVAVNGIYENLVNAGRIMEDKPANFEAEGLKWGEALNNVVIMKDGVPYIKFIQKEGDKAPTYIDQDGNEVDAERVKKFMPPYSGSKKQELENEVDVRTYKLDNIVSLELGGKEVYHQ